VGEENEDLEPLDLVFSELARDDLRFLRLEVEAWNRRWVVLVDAGRGPWASWKGMTSGGRDVKVGEVDARTSVDRFDRC